MQPQNVVVIEDSSDDFDTLVRTYRRLDPSVVLVHFDTGELFLQAVLDHLQIPAYILLDLNLPGLSGLDVLAVLKADRDWGFVPVIVFSGSRRPADVKAAYQAGADAYVVKELDPGTYQHRFALLHRYWTEVVELAPYPSQGRVG
jgi:CheY-like chemotaxis protein